MGHADNLLAKLARDQHQVFTMNDATGCGITRDQVRFRVKSGEYVRLHQGVYSFANAPESFGRALFAALASAPSDARATGPTAARVYGLPGAADEPLEITCARWRRTHRDDGLIVHERIRNRSKDIRMVDGFAVSSPELVIVELMHRCGYLVGERAHHEARRRRLITHASLETVFLRHARRGAPGIARTRVLLNADADPGAPTESVRETMLLQVIRRAGIPEPVRQLEVFDDLGSFIGRADFAYPSIKATVEYHSLDWHSTPEAVEADERRRNALIAAGWLPLIARRDDLMRRSGADVIAALRRVFADRT